MNLSENEVDKKIHSFAWYNHLENVVRDTGFFCLRRGLIENKSPYWLVFHVHTLFFEPEYLL